MWKSFKAIWPHTKGLLGNFYVFVLITLISAWMILVGLGPLYTGDWLETLGGIFFAVVFATTWLTSLVCWINSFIQQN